MAQATYRDPVRPVNREFLAGLTLESTKVYPLPGSVGRRLSNEYDPRLSQLKGLTPTGDEVVYFEHIATIRHKASNTFYVAFRETMDAFLVRQQDPLKYPEWLMKSPEKQAERQVYIHQVKQVPSKLMTSQDQWLQELPDNDGGAFDTLAYFLAQNKVIDEQVLATLR